MATYFNLRARLSDGSVVDWDVNPYDTEAEASSSYSLKDMQTCMAGRMLLNEGRHVVARVLVKIEETETDI